MDPPAAANFYAPDRSGAHAETWLSGYAGLVPADAFSGFGHLYEPHCKPGAIIEAACWAHARRKFFEIADLQKAPVAMEAVARIGRDINGRSPEETHILPQKRSPYRRADPSHQLTGHNHLPCNVALTGNPF